MAAIADAVEEIKFLTALPLFGEDIPRRYWSGRWSPDEPPADEPEPQGKSAAQLREEANELRREIGLPVLT